MTLAVARKPVLFMARNGVVTFLTVMEKRTVPLTGFLAKRLCRVPLGPNLIDTVPMMAKKLVHRGMYLKYFALE